MTEKTTPGSSPEPSKPDTRQWAVRRDGEILFDVLGPDAEALVRSTAQARNGVVIYRDYLPPSDDYPASHWGPWRDA